MPTRQVAALVEETHHGALADSRVQHARHAQVCRAARRQAASGRVRGAGSALASDACTSAAQAAAAPCRQGAPGAASRRGPSPAAAPAILSRPLSSSSRFAGLMSRWMTRWLGGGCRIHGGRCQVPTTRQRPGAGQPCCQPSLCKACASSGAAPSRARTCACAPARARPAAGMPTRAPPGSAAPAARAACGCAAGGDGGNGFASGSLIRAGSVHARSRPCSTRAPSRRPPLHAWHASCPRTQAHLMTSARVPPLTTSMRRKTAPFSTKLALYCAGVREGGGRNGVGAGAPGVGANRRRGCRTRARQRGRRQRLERACPLQPAGAPPVGVPPARLAQASSSSSGGRHNHQTPSNQQPLEPTRTASAPAVRWGGAARPAGAAR